MGAGGALAAVGPVTGGIEPDTLGLLLRLGTAVALGALLGLERELGSQPAGLRTHVLVCLGAALFTVGGTYVGDADPGRVAAGFGAHLAAGAVTLGALVVLVPLKWVERHAVPDRARRLVSVRVGERPLPELVADLREVLGDVTVARVETTGQEAELVLRVLARDDDPAGLAERLRRVDGVTGVALRGR